MMDDASGDPTDQTLLVRLVGGDESAFDTLFFRHRLAVFRFLRQRTGGESAVADDLCQECFLRLWRGRETLRSGRAAVRTLLLTIARNLAEDYRKRRIVPTLALLCDDRTEGTLPASSVDAPENALLDRELHGKLEQALDCLSDDLREAFLLREEGLTYAAIAEQVGCPIETVRSRLYLARTRLRRALEPYLKESVPVRHIVTGTEQRDNETLVIHRESSLEARNTGRIESGSGVLYGMGDEL